ncbi:glycosyltransferase family 2 protein [Tamlana flava]|uniref:glycosyltransferase family 2 protein n=1 Tax=Tamlana flava TaxID=3158572 RepID=UPI00351AD2AD
MVVIYHLNNKVHEIVVEGNQHLDFNKHLSLSRTLHVLANQFPDEKIVWCHVSCKPTLNLKFLESRFHHNRLMLSFGAGEHLFLNEQIGYVDMSSFIKVNKNVSYPTWQMSSTVGAIHASVLLLVKDQIPQDSNFDYYLNSLAKLAIPLGLFCYSEPNLILEHNSSVAPKSQMLTLFKFVKQHYKTRWLYLLVLNGILYERKFWLLPFLYALCFVKNRYLSVDFNSIDIKSSEKVTDKTTVDVIIPTIGRKAYLYNVLCDLRGQTLLPENVIIVEQNPLKGSVSDLDYLKTESWPFNIKHHFLHKTGACNARNKALKEVISEFAFFADDDVRLQSNALYESTSYMICHGIEAITLSCKAENEIEKIKIPIQWSAFGSGCSIVKTSALGNITFNLGYEHGFGEDSDFGAQLRNKGTDIIYYPEISLKHLKAPIGGFRTKPMLPWKEDMIQPKPSPTVMLFQLLHKTKEQRLGYKTVLFLKYYKNQSIRNPFTYFKVFKKQWQQSLKYAHHLKSIKSP